MRVAPLFFASLGLAALFWTGASRAEATDAELLARPLTFPEPPRPPARNEPAFGPLLIMVGAASFATGYLGTLALSRYADGPRPERPWDARVAIPVAGPYFAFARLPDQECGTCDALVLYSMMFYGAAVTQAAGLALLGYGATVTIRDSRVAIVPAPNGLALGGAF